MTRHIVVLMVLSSPCFCRDYWKQTKEGMSKAALMRLYGKQLKPYAPTGHPVGSHPDAWEYSTDSPESYCGGNFIPIFSFDESQPKRGLVAVQLELERGENADGRVGDCVLKEYRAKYGHPKKSAEVQGPGQYAFSGARVVLYIFPERVTIIYRGRCPWWQFGCGQLVL